MMFDSGHFVAIRSSRRLSKSKNVFELLHGAALPPKTSTGSVSRYIPSSNESPLIRYEDIAAHGFTCRNPPFDTFRKHYNRISIPTRAPVIEQAPVPPSEPPGGCSPLTSAGSGAASTGRTAHTRAEAHLPSFRQSPPPKESPSPA